MMMNVNICLRLAQHVTLVCCFFNTVGLTFKEIAPEKRSVSVFLSEMRGCNKTELVQFKQMGDVDFLVIP